MEELISYRNTKFVRLPISDGRFPVRLDCQLWFCKFKEKKEYSIIQTDL